MPVFIDASFMTALADPRDPWHPAVQALKPEVDARRPFHVHALAVAEVVANIGSRRGGTAARHAYEAMRDDMVLHLPTAEDLDESMELIVRFDGGLSLSDAYALLVVEREGLDAIVSFDDDFDKAGVERIHEVP